MNSARRWTIATTALAIGLLCSPGFAEVTYEERDGVRYQVTRQVSQRQVPTTVMREQQQTVYSQQVVTDSFNHQQVYCVPVTQYQLQAQLRGRWNPFITPYWTYNLSPVTQWQQQVANVQIPVSRVSWVPQTRVVQVPTTEYRMAEEEKVTRVALGDSRTLSSAQPLSRSTATLAARPSVSTTSSTPIGGVVMDNDPPREGTAWQNPPDSRYR